MTHRFPIKEIAQQAGLSTATVDRVLNGRPNVSAQTKGRVAAALKELEAQEGQLAARGRRLFIDVVVEAPERFSREIRAAAEAVLPLAQPAVIRPRFTLAEVMDVPQTVAVLDRIAKRGSHGVCLKARDVPQINAAIARLQERGIPVVTLFTDAPTSGRLFYAGIDNESAGRTAAQLMAGRVQSGIVLTSHSRTDFQGEAARNAGFVSEMQQRAPMVQIQTLPDAAGRNTDTGQALASAIEGQTGIAGVYSAGGGNRAIHAGLTRAGLIPKVFIGHDLDGDNLTLLIQDALSFVLYHDLQADLLAGFRHILGAHRLIPTPPDAPSSDIQIIVPGNIPHRFRENEKTPAAARVSSSS